MYQCNAVFISLQSQHHSNLQNSIRKNEKTLFNIIVVLLGSCGQPTERLFVSLNTFLFGHESCGDPVVVSGNNISGEAPPRSSSLLVSFMASEKWWEGLLTLPSLVRLHLALKDAIHPVFSNTQGVYSCSTNLERQRPPPGYKPKQSAFFCDFSTFQNGGNSLVKRPFKERRFYGQTGLKRGLLYCPNLKTASKVPKFNLERNCTGFYSLPFGLASASRTFTKSMHLR